MVLKEDIEKLEKTCLDFVWESIPKDQSFYQNNFSQLSFDELFQLISRQNVGRGKNYIYELSELINNINSLTPEMALELKSRIASSSIFSKAFEGITQTSLIRTFVSKGIEFKLNTSPNSPNFSVFLELADTFTQISSEDIHGVLLNVETKSTNGFANLGDALTSNYFGRFQVGFNQITYDPLTLRLARQESEKLHLGKKYSTLPGYKKWKDKTYIVVTIFVTYLCCLSNDMLVLDELKQINGSYFNHYIMCTCIPHFDLISDYYDRFFSPGKGGSEAEYPKDYRFQIYNDNDKFLLFENLNNGDARFKYINENGEYNSFEYSKGTFDQKTFFIHSPETY